MSVPTAKSPEPQGARLSLARWLFTPLAGVKLGDWMGVMGRYGHSIPPRYWPRTAFTLAMSSLNSALSRRERRRYGPAVDGVTVRRPVFVLGHHRSGTTHLWNLLAQDTRFAHPRVLQAVFPHTFLTFESMALGMARRLSPRKRPQDNVDFGPEAPIEEERAICASCFRSIQMARHFPRTRDSFSSYLTLRDADQKARDDWKRALDQFARKLLVRYGDDKTLLFKAPDHTGKIALILELYPDARFVYIHRDPYEVFRSTRKMERDTVPFYAYQMPDEDSLDAFILWRYRAMHEAYFADRDEVPPGQLVELSFNDLDRDPVGQLERIYHAIDLPDFEAVRAPVTRYAESLSGYRKNAYTALPALERKSVADAWRPCFEAWGYPE